MDIEAIKKYFGDTFENMKEFLTEIYGYEVDDKEVALILTRKTEI